MEVYIRNKRKRNHATNSELPEIGRHFVDMLDWFDLEISPKIHTTPKRHFWSDSLSLQPPFSTSASQTALNQVKTGRDVSEKKCANGRLLEVNIRLFIEKVSKCHKNGSKCEQPSESAPIFEKSQTFEERDRRSTSKT